MLRSRWGEDQCSIFQMRKLRPERGHVQRSLLRNGGTPSRIQASFLSSSNPPPSVTFCQLPRLPSRNKWLKVNCWLDFPFLKSQEVCVVCNCGRTISGQLHSGWGHKKDWVPHWAGLPATQAVQRHLYFFFLRVMSVCLPKSGLKLLSKELTKLLENFKKWA